MIPPIAAIRCTLLLALLTQCLCLIPSLANPSNVQIQETTLLHDIVTWDQYSISVHGERIIFLSGEFHPFRLPSPGLWLDVFQKIRALGFTGVSFYLDWALLEGEQGNIRTKDIFALDQFFDAASEAGIYFGRARISTRRSLAVAFPDGCSGSRAA